jgi:hypothetical protein
MVERPIKKSERQAKTDESSSGGDRPTSEASPRESGTARPTRDKDRGKDRGKGKGKKGSREEEPRQAVNPALVRGPRPTRPQPPVEEVQPEVHQEAVAEESTDTPETTDEETPVES